MDQPIVYAADIGKRGRRLGGLIAVAGSLLAVAGLWLLFQFDRNVFGFAAWVASAGTLIAGGAAISFFGRLAGTADWLKLDAQGLALTHNGKSRIWRWSDVRAIERRGAFNPLSPVRGKALVLSVNHDGGGSGLQRPCTAVIANNYLTSIDDIASTLRDLHARAYGRSGRAPRDRRRQADGPDMFLGREANRTPAADLGSRLRTIAGWGLGLGATGAGGLYALVGWPPDWSALREFLKEYDWVRSVVIGVISGSVVQLFNTNAAGEVLILSSDGLHWRHKRQRRHWRWQDLRGVALRTGEPAVTGTEGAAAEITFLARGDGTDAKVKPDAPASAFAIEDIYDTPLAEIVRRIEFWHPQASQPEFEPADSGIMAAGLQTVRYRLGSRGQSSAIAALGFSVFMALNLVALAVLIWFAVEGLAMIDDSWSKWSRLAVLLPILVFCLAAMSLGVFVLLPRANFVQMDADGLTFRRLGLRRRWAWRELASVELRTARLRWRSEHSVLGVFSPPRDDWLSRLMRWCYRLDSGPPLVPIEQAYEAPVEEIARRFADYRGRDLGGMRPVG